MSVKELDVAPGFETQIAVSPVLYATTGPVHLIRPPSKFVSAPLRGKGVLEGGLIK